MKIIKNLCVNNNTKRVTCYNCKSELEITNDDLEVGKYGLKYFVCPCCGECSYIEEDEDSVTLTEDNLNFPQHYDNFKKENVSDDMINKLVKKSIEQLKYEQVGNYVTRETGNVFVEVFKYEDGYDIIVAKNYYETHIEL